MARKTGKLVQALPCEVCGAPAVVRIRDQHYCGTCAVEYQRVRQYAHEQGMRPARTQVASPERP